MSVVWKNIFDNYGIKTVTNTDKNKSAYVPNVAQCIAIAAAGISHSKARPADVFEIVVLNDKVRSIKASFYHSERVTAPDRTPEPRMGREFISSHWLQTGDKLIIGNIGSQLFAAKQPDSFVSDEEVAQDVLSKADEKTIIDRAKKAKGRPPRKAITRDDFQRNPYVVAAAIIRSKGKCEMPECSNALFLRGDDKPYLEVHHVIPLGEGGDDTYANVAALCPHCHRELHFGKSRKPRRTVLEKHIATLK